MKCKVFLIIDRNLLAFGNGCPDFFTSFAGIDESLDFVFGSAVGSTIFLVTFVLGTLQLFAYYSRPLRKENVLDSVVVSSSVCVVKIKDSNPMKITSRFSFLKNSVILISAVVSLFTLLFVKEISIAAPITFIVLFCIHMGVTIVTQIVASKGSKLKKQEEEDDSDSDDMEVEKDQDVTANMISVWLDYTGWKDMDLGQKILFIFRAPIDLMGLLSIPPMYSQDPYQEKEEKRPSCMYIDRILLVLNPWFSFALILFAFEVFHLIAAPGFPVWALYVILSGVCSLCFYYIRHERIQPLMVIYGFVLCILWMYILSKELVSILTSIGEVFSIKRVILGIVVLAIGNTFGDMISNIAIARTNQGFETAAFACITGPIQNILLSLGVAMLKTILMGEMDNSSSSSPELVFSFVFLLCVLVTLIILFQLQAMSSVRVGYILVVIYPIYVAVFLAISLLHQ